MSSAETVCLCFVITTIADCYVQHQADFATILWPLLHPGSVLVQNAHLAIQMMYIAPWKHLDNADGQGWSAAQRSYSLHQGNGAQIPLGWQNRIPGRSGKARAWTTGSFGPSGGNGKGLWSPIVNCPAVCMAFRWCIHTCTWHKRKNCTHCAFDCNSIFCHVHELELVHWCMPLTKTPEVDHSLCFGVLQCIPLQCA